MILNMSANDQMTLVEALANRLPDEHERPQSYADCVVLKPWGYEFELFDDQKLAIWLLNINAQRATSLHCHRLKTACFMPLTEGIEIVTMSGLVRLGQGQQVVANPGVFHSVWNNSATAAVLLEIETPPDKFDLIRAQDAYGREKSGYEGGSSLMRENLAQYGHARLRENHPVRLFGHELSLNDEGFQIRRLADA